MPDACLPALTPSPFALRAPSAAAPGNPAFWLPAVERALHTVLLLAAQGAMGHRSQAPRVRRWQPAAHCVDQARVLSALATLGMLQAPSLASALASSAASQLGLLAALSAPAASALLWALTVQVRLV